MDNKDFVLNDVFEKSAKVYQTKPVRATKYKPGMENGWMVYFSHEPYAGVKFFPTEADARKFIEANEKQYVNIDGKRIGFDVQYDLLKPVLLRKTVDPENKVGGDFCLGEYAFESNENDDYDFYDLDENQWLIQDADGNIRVWEDFNMGWGESFFGLMKDIIYEKTPDDTYMKVAI